MATAFYNQTTLFYNKTNGLSFAFTPRERSKWAQCCSRDGKASSYSHSMVQSKVKIHKILSPAHDIGRSEIQQSTGASFKF